MHDRARVSVLEHSRERGVGTNGARVRGVCVACAWRVRVVCVVCSRVHTSARVAHASSCQLHVWVSECVWGLV
eukprot:6197979-Pleurochrysis_carterae.AAC.1